MAELEKRLACVIRSDDKITRGYIIERGEFDGVNGYVITWKFYCRVRLCCDHLQRRGRADLAWLYHGQADKRSVPDAGVHL